MNGTHRDQALTAALAHSLGHAAPFSELECRDVTALALTHCHEISDLAWCPNLRSLEISNSDIHDLRFVEALPHLETLKIYGAPVSDVQPITHCPQLTRLDLCFTLVADLATVLQLPRLTSGVMLGNPWSLSTRQTIIPELLNLIPGKQRPRAFMFSSETDWRNTLTLQSYGLPLCQSTLTLGGGFPVIVRPGIPAYTQGNCDFFTSAEYSINMLLRHLEKDRAGVTDAVIFEWVSGELGDDPRALDLTRLPEIGTAADALIWIREASVPDAHKDYYRQFVAHFPHLTFCRGTTALMGYLADAAERYTPEWFAASLATLAYALPFQAVEFQFFEDQIGDFELLKPWHALDFNEGPYDEFANAGASMRPVTIAGGTKGSTSGLAIDAASARTAIYSYDRDMYEEYEELDAGLHVAFTSYAKMLAGLRVMRIVCGEKTWKIKAQTA